MIREKWYAFPVGNNKGMFTSGFLKGEDVLRISFGDFPEVIRRRLRSQDFVFNLTNRYYDNVVVVYDAGSEGKVGIKQQAVNLWRNMMLSMFRGNVRTRSLLIIFVSHFHDDHVNLIWDVIRNWEQFVDIQNSKILLIFPSGLFLEGSLCVRSISDARDYFGSVVLDSLASLFPTEDKEKKVDEEDMYNMYLFVRFVYGDDTVLQKFKIKIPSKNIYRVMVPTLERGEYSGWLRVLDGVPDEGFGKDSLWLPSIDLGNKEEFVSGEGGEGCISGGYKAEGGWRFWEFPCKFGLGCPYCVRLTSQRLWLREEDMSLAEWWMRWNPFATKETMDRTFILTHKFKGNSPYPGLWLYRNMFINDPVHVFMPYFAEEVISCKYPHRLLVMERRLFYNMMLDDRDDELLKCIRKIYGCILKDLNESSMLLFHAAGMGVRSGHPKGDCNPYLRYGDLRIVPHTVKLDFDDERRWFLMTGDQKMERIAGRIVGMERIPGLVEKWRDEKIRLPFFFRNKSFAWVQVPHHGSAGNWFEKEGRSAWWNLPESGQTKCYFISSSTNKKDNFKVIGDLLVHSKFVIQILNP